VVLGAERSLALHAKVADKLLADPTILVRAQKKLDEWISGGGSSAPLWERWREILEGTPEQVASFLRDPSEEAAWLRKASPFAGVLDPRERLEVLRGLRRPAPPIP
jgi:hypothetical protein